MGSEEVPKPDPAGLVRADDHFPGLFLCNEEFSISVAPGHPTILRSIPFPQHFRDSAEFEMVSFSGKASQPENHPGCNDRFICQSIDYKPGYFVSSCGKREIVML